MVELGTQFEDAMAQARAWIAEHPRAKQPWDEKSYCRPGPLPVAKAMGILSGLLFKKTGAPSLAQSRMPSSKEQC